MYINNIILALSFKTPYTYADFERDMLSDIQVYSCDDAFINFRMFLGNM